MSTTGQPARVRRVHASSNVFIYVISAFVLGIVFMQIIPPIFLADRAIDDFSADLNYLGYKVVETSMDEEYRFQFTRATVSIGDCRVVLRRDVYQPMSAMVVSPHKDSRRIEFFRVNGVFNAPKSISAEDFDHEGIQEQQAYIPDELTRWMTNKGGVMAACIAST